MLSWSGKNVKQKSQENKKKFEPAWLMEILFKQFPPEVAISIQNKTKSGLKTDQV
jgi:hypothetical protein